jgi:4,5-dihydroxyphthalate decarboxylase
LPFTLGEDVSRIQLNIALGRAGIHTPVFLGEVQAAGVEVNAIPMTVEEIFWRQTQYQEFDACEYPGAGYVIQKARGTCPVTAIPAFPLRAFRQNTVYINAHAGIERPEDLKGRRMGAGHYEMTMMVWVRDFLARDYDVQPSDLTWVTGGFRDAGRKPRVHVQLPPEIRIEEAPEGRTLEGMLEDGEIDALIGPRVPEPMARGSRNIRRLFPDFRAVEADYYRRTGLFPIMHTVAIKSELVERYPWLPMSLYQMLDQARRLSLERLADDTAYLAPLPWLPAHLDADRAVMGCDLWPYGAEANRHTFGHLAQIAFEQHLAPRAVPYQELFAPSTYEEFKI